MVSRKTRRPRREAAENFVIGRRVPPTIDRVFLPWIPPDSWIPRVGKISIRRGSAVNAWPSSAIRMTFRKNPSRKRSASGFRFSSIDFLLRDVVCFTRNSTHYDCTRPTKFADDVGHFLCPNSGQLFAVCRLFSRSLSMLVSCVLTSRPCTSCHGQSTPYAESSVPFRSVRTFSFPFGGDFPLVIV